MAPAADPFQFEDVAHDPGHDLARARARRVAPVDAARIAGGLDVQGGGRVLIGTASWTDPTLTSGEIFYPAGRTTPEARLRHYAGCFPLVEVDSSYYALPTTRMAAAWAERTPDGFTFDVKAHALMTGQPSEVARLPRDLREALPAALRTRPKVYDRDLPAEIVDEVWARFLAALAPLRASGKLGAVLLQYPRWITPTRGHARRIADARRRLGDDTGAVELRHRGWFDTPARTRRLLDLLRDEGLAHVMVDGPPGLESSVPRVAAVTTPHLALIRLHGRRSDLWERAGVPTVERYRYLYDAAQLAEWLEPVLDAAMSAQRTHMLFNNCHGNYGTTNAVEIGAMMIDMDRARRALL